MSAPAFPIARHGADILSPTAQGLKLCVREKEATEASGHPVKFVSEHIGPEFPSPEAAEAFILSHYPFLSDVAYLKLQARFKPAPKGRGAKDPCAPNNTLYWQISVSYWKILFHKALPKPQKAPLGQELQARALRKQELGQALSAEEIHALIDHPLSAYRPQKALDIGLFEYRPPDNPHIVIADE